LSLRNMLCESCRRRSRKNKTLYKTKEAVSDFFEKQRPFYFKERSKLFFSKIKTQRLINLFTYSKIEIKRRKGGAMVVKTLQLKLHNPSKTKRRIMDEALLNYSYALQYLLDSTHDRIRRIRSEAERAGRGRMRRVAALIDKKELQELNKFGVEPFKDSLKMDYASWVIGYLTIAKRQNNAGYPLLTLNEEQLNDAVFNAIERYDCDEMGRRRLDIFLSRVYGKYNKRKSILFGRYAKTRDYCLLYDRENDRYYAKLYLMNVKSKKRRGNIKRGATQLEYIAPGEREYLPEDNRQERYIIVPLETGKWQRKMLKHCREHPEMLKTARLTAKGKDYYILINIKCCESPQIKPVTTLGVCRSLKGQLRYSIALDQPFSGKLLYPSGGKPDKQLYHALANDICALALRHKAQVVAYKLGEKADNIAFEGKLPLLTAGEYNKVIAMSAYKLELAGLPAPILVSPRGVFHTCPECGRNTQRNRISEKEFMCSSCGYYGCIEEVGSRNLSNILESYRKRKVTFRVRKGKGDTLVFYNEILGIKFETQDTVMAQGQFYQFLQEHISDMREAPLFFRGLTTEQQKKRYSLYQKLFNMEDVRLSVAVVREM